MSRPGLFAIALLPLFITSCGGNLPEGTNPTPTTPAASAPMPPLGLFALKASNGSYVSCAMPADSTGGAGLFANRPTIGANEVFTAWYDNVGHFGFVASNGKFITADRKNGGMLVADRDLAGEWETFEIVDAGNGLYALKNTNGQFVCAHYELPGTQAAQLRADRPDVHEWEQFEIVRDPRVAL